MLKIGFRVDASTHIGLGHLMEILAIIECLQKKIKFLPLIITSTEKTVKTKLESSSKIKVVTISQNINELIDARETVERLAKFHCVHLVTDLMIRSGAYYRYLERRVQSLCVIHDDAKHRETRGQAVINFSLAQNQKFYTGLSGSYYLGPSYMPMNGRILKYRRRQRITAVKNIFINQGGGDPFGLTAKIIRALKPLELSSRINVVIGGALKPRHALELKKIARKLPANWHCYHNIVHEKVLQMMAEADLALSAPGNALYELAYFKMPTIVISHHSRHDAIAKAFEKKAAIVNLGIGQRMALKRIAEATIKLIKNKDERISLARNIGELVDGRGLDRVSRIIINACQNNSEY